MLKEGNLTWIVWPIKLAGEMYLNSDGSFGPKRAKARARGMRADRRAVNPAAQIGEVIVIRAGEGRGLEGDKFTVAVNQGDKRIGVGQGAGEELALAL